MSSGVKITGMKELNQVMSGLKKFNQHKIMGSVLYKASKPMMTAQKQIAAQKTTRRTGNLDTSIGRMKVSMKKAAEIGTVRVGPRIGGRYKGYHGHLIEFGTKDRYTKKGAYRGRGPSLPFVAPAFTGQLEQVKKNIYTEFNRLFNTLIKTGQVVETEVIEND